MRTETTFLLYFLLAIIMSVPTKTKSQDCKGYFPMKEGVKFEISSYNAKGKFESKAIHEVVKKESKSNGLALTVLSLLYDNKEKQVGELEYMLMCEDGVFKVDMNAMINKDVFQNYEGMEMSVEGGYLEFPDDPQPGQVLNDGNISIRIGSSSIPVMTINTRITNRKVIGREDLSTAAGDYNCIKFSYDIETQMLLKVQAKAVEWYAEGVGMVRQESYNRKGKLIAYSELTGFSKP